MTRFLIVALMVIALGVGVVGALDGAVNGWAAEQRDRAELVRTGGSWQPTPQPGIHYQEAVRVPAAPGVRP